MGGAAVRGDARRSGRVLALGGASPSPPISAAGTSASCSTTLANATLFGNSATLDLPDLRLPRRARAGRRGCRRLALALAAIGAGAADGAIATSSRPSISPATCSACSRACSTPSISSLMARARETMAPMPALALSSLAGVAAAAARSRSRWARRSCRGNWRPLIALALVSQLIGQGLMIYALGASLAAGRSASRC